MATNSDFDIGSYPEVTGTPDPAQSDAVGLGDYGFYDVPDPNAFGGYMEYADMAPSPVVGLGDYEFFDTPSQPSFFDTPFGKTVRAVSNLFPAGRAVNTIASIMDGNWGKAVSSAVPGVPGLIGSTAIDAAQGKANPSGITGAMGSTVGGQAFGPFGSLAGGILGSSVGKDMPSYAGGPAGSGGTNGMGDNQDFLGGLLGLWGASQARGIGGSNYNSALNTQMNNLASMYGPNSPYAAQMRQELARKDAAAGRRSQYGPREVQLQALLAGKQTEAANAMSNLARGGTESSIARANYNNQLLGQRLKFLKGIGDTTGLTGRVNSTLQGMFGNGPFNMRDVYGTGSVGDVGFGLGSMLPTASTGFDVNNIGNYANFSNSLSGGGSGNPLLDWEF